MINCLITGVGGQGTVLASKLLAQAALVEGYEVRTTETIGMAQRGGSVVSHVRMGTEIFSPLISKKQADLIIGFEPAESVRVLPYLKDGGTMVVSRASVKPIINPEAYKSEEALAFLKANVTNLKIIDGEAICKACNHPKVLNIALLGAGLACGILPVSREVVEEVIKSKVKAQFVALNLKALDLGFEEGRV